MSTPPGRHEEELHPPPPALEEAGEDGAADDDADAQIDDPALLAAVQQQLDWRTGFSTNRGLGSAFVIALALHLLLIAACLALAVKLHVFSPRLEFAQGPAGSQGDLVADAADQTPQDNSVPGPAVAMPEIARTSTPPQALPDDPNPPPELRPDAARQTRLDLPPDPADPLAFGIRADPIGPAPKWHRSARAETTQPPARSTAQASSAAPAVAFMPARHSYAPPRGAGRAGGTNQDAAYDDRGIPIPDYPPESYRRHEEGTVELQVLVKTDGSVGRASIVKSSSFPRLDQAALAAMRVARFTPGTCDGAPVAMQVVVPFRFVIQ